jgi:hypothetical protein
MCHRSGFKRLCRDFRVRYDFVPAYLVSCELQSAPVIEHAFGSSDGHRVYLGLLNNIKRRRH